MKFPIRLPRLSHERLQKLAADMGISLEEAAETAVIRFSELPTEERQAIVQQHYFDNGGSLDDAIEVPLSAVANNAASKGKVDKWSRLQVCVAAVCWLLALSPALQKDLLCTGTANKTARLIVLIEQYKEQGDYRRLLKQLRVWINDCLEDGDDQQTAVDFVFSSFGKE